MESLENTAMNNKELKSALSLNEKRFNDWRAQSNDPHFDKIFFKDLTVDDLVIMNKFLDGNLTEEELRVHQRKVADELIAIKMKKRSEGEDFNTTDNSRMNFLGLIGNKLFRKAA